MSINSLGALVEGRERSASCLSSNLTTKTDWGSRPKCPTSMWRGLGGQISSGDGSCRHSDTHSAFAWLGGGSRQPWLHSVSLSSCSIHTRCCSLPSISTGLAKIKLENKLENNASAAETVQTDQTAQLGVFIKQMGGGLPSFCCAPRGPMLSCLP